MNIAFLKESQQIAHALVAKAVVKMLKDIEMQYAFGVSIGACCAGFHGLFSSFRNNFIIATSDLPQFCRKCKLGNELCVMTC
ncbi:hypothetical protein [Nostoc sphaeroides]|uniref:Uncharacterized protein n=1 Tax=Nostoc sphaeroides CCNUC1 TaxID=2653204 RepID=A0A5P8WFR2_9NOSO|nr:hypothetical protein [Nostoc sphaeroides]QFS51683.1 hypothetical protein GXM_09177 [Nostoc sphaeroides CCNUC1]